MCRRFPWSASARSSTDPAPLRAGARAGKQRRQRGTRRNRLKKRKFVRPGEPICPSWHRKGDWLRATTCLAGEKRLVIDGGDYVTGCAMESITDATAPEGRLARDCRRDWRRIVGRFHVASGHEIRQRVRILSISVRIAGRSGGHACSTSTTPDLTLGTHGT